MKVGLKRIEGVPSPTLKHSRRHGAVNDIVLIDDFAKGCRWDKDEPGEILNMTQFLDSETAHRVVRSRSRRRLACNQRLIVRWRKGHLTVGDERPSRPATLDL